MSDELIVDIEKVLSVYLREHADIVALEARVVAKTPEKTDLPWIQVTLIDGSQTDSADHLTAFVVQLDAYAGLSRGAPGGPGSVGGQPESNLLARTTRAVLHGMRGQTLPGAVIGDVRFAAGMARIPDTDFKPPRDRIVLTCEIWAHAIPEP